MVRYITMTLIILGYLSLWGLLLVDGTLQSHGNDVLVITTTECKVYGVTGPCPEDPIEISSEEEDEGEQENVPKSEDGDQSGEAAANNLESTEGGGDVGSIKFPKCFKECGDVFKGREYRAFCAHSKDIGTTNCAFPCTFYKCYCCFD